eukprot:6033264-Alexandrium_andersonii.AAC.1
MAMPVACSGGLSCVGVCGRGAKDAKYAALRLPWPGAQFCLRVRGSALRAHAFLCERARSE